MRDLLDLPEEERQGRLKAEHKLTDPERPVCPPDVAEAVLIILKEGLLRIRMAGNADDADFCADEANHLHNLPSMLRWFTWKLLDRYVTYVRQSYGPDLIARFGHIPQAYQAQWQALEEIYQRHVEADADDAPA